MDTQEKLKLICKSAYDRKADDIVIMDMSKHSGLCDSYVIMSAPSTVRVRAIADHIDEMMKKVSHGALHKEGYRDSLWILMDYYGVVVHIFYQDTRLFYDMENLWGDVPKKKYHPKG